MTLYSSPVCASSHSARFVLSEKGIAADIVYIDIKAPPEDLIELNPYGVAPTLVDRDFVLYDAQIIMEYLDERFPHPPLHHMDPVSRAQARMLIHRIKNDWYSLLEEMNKYSDKQKASKAKKKLRESLMVSNPIFEAKPYFMSDRFSMVDCVLAPVLWRLPSLGIELPKQAEAIKSYAARVFGRDSFKESMSDSERDMSSSYMRLTA